MACRVPAPAMTALPNPPNYPRNKPDGKRIGDPDAPEQRSKESRAATSSHLRS